MRTLFVVAITLLLITTITVSVQGEQDPYIIHGSTYYNGKKASNITVTFTYDKHQTFDGTPSSFNTVVHSSKSGFYNIVIDNYTEGDTYTIQAKYDNYRVTETGRIILYDKEGYQRMGDEIDLHIYDNNTEKREHRSYDIFLYGSLPFLGVLVCLVIRRDIKIQKEVEARRK